MLEASIKQGLEVNSVAMPSQVEILQRRYREMKEEEQKEKSRTVEERYGIKSTEV